MSIANWDVEAYQHLQKANYEKIIDIYQLLIDQQPNLISNYWYLGLAYLLQGKEEEAQFTWLVALSKQSDDDNEQENKQLVQILEQEANRQEINQNEQIAWLIRGNIRELEPDNLSNILSLISLDVSLGDMNGSKIVEWGAIDLVNSVARENISETLLNKVLQKILCIVSEESLEFARVCLAKFADSKLILQTITNTASKIETSTPDYPISLVDICYQNNPHNLEVINSLFYLCLKNSSNNDQSYEQALICGKQFLEHSQSLADDILGYSQLLLLFLRTSNSQEALNLYPTYLSKLNDLKIKAEKKEIISFDANTKPHMPFFSYALLYLQDKPVQNRYFCNLFGKIFQDLVDSTITNNQNKYKRKNNVTQLNSQRPLKIGYIANTIRGHSVGILSRWLVRYHNKERFKIYIYYWDQIIDEITEKWFVKNAEKFYFDNNKKYKYCSTLPQKIQDDGIDILVDLDSLTYPPTMSVMAHKPAPIQITWLGLDASGIPSIDYFIADPYVLPENAQNYYSEKIWRLPQTYLAIDGFEINTPTLTREDLNISSDAIIFMNLQSGYKRHPNIIKMQMRILKSVPNSYLLVKGAGNKSITENLFFQLASEEGVELERLRFLGHNATTYSHRGNLALADVVLDTYPYNGATTTLEILWAGIPMVTRVGEQFAARNSYTFMVNAGISEGIAWTDEEYVEWGIKLGTDESLRRDISWKLKESRKTAPLWNAKQFTKEMEDAYQQMWNIYLENYLSKN